jgi:hypothetical protein
LWIQGENHLNIYLIGHKRATKTTISNLNYRFEVVLKEISPFGRNDGVMGYIVALRATNQPLLVCHFERSEKSL